MNALNKWLVCLDLTKMDELLVGYVSFLAKILKPKEVQFVHIIETNNFNADILELFEDVNSIEDLQERLKDHFEDLIDDLFEVEGVKTKFFIEKGTATNRILALMKTWPYDLLVLGKKNSYIGEGVAARKLVKYVPASILMVPETARYTMDHVTVPVDFSEQSARATNLAFQLADKQPDRITLQHIYEPPKEFFPYMPGEKEKKQAHDNAIKAAAEFIRDYKINEDVDVELTLFREERMSDEIYNLCNQKKSDLIVVGYRARKNLIASLKDNLPERMSGYGFGIPLLIVKNPKTTLNLYESLIDAQ
ncbi:MAG: universal stress protein [Bacteroidetes bacterium]|nr:universal stress protein [Bacteroidota bacterium]MCH8523955.1 universal stress protein [Balneolales bacterium]